MLDSHDNLLVADYNSAVTIYAPPYSGTPTVITSGLVAAAGLALDSTGNLFVGNAGANTLLEYAPPYTAAPVTTTGNSVNGPYAIALDGAGNLFSANGNVNTVTEYAPPYGGAPVATISSGISSATFLLFSP